MLQLKVEKKWVENIKNFKSNQNNYKRFIIKDKLESILTKDIGDFVSERSLISSKKFNLPYDFLNDEIVLWPMNDSYRNVSHF